jgi:ribosomal protein L24E
MVECDYCGNQLRKTEGKMLVLNSGEKLYFCNSSCEKNHDKDRKHSHRKQE